MRLDLLEPVLNVVECALFRAVVHKHDSHCSLVIRLSDRPEAFLTRCVPDLEFDALVFNIDRFNLEVNP